MLLLRCVLCGILAMLFLGTAIRVLRTGQFKVRGGGVITRGSTPMRFWGAILLLGVLSVGAVVLMWAAITKARLGT